MATINPKVDNYFLENEVYTWPLLANGDAGAPAGYTGAGDRTVQVTGVFGTSGNLDIEGSLDGINWFVLNDPLGVALHFTVAGIKLIAEQVIQVRPRATAGDATTALTVILAVRRSQRG